MCLYYENYVAIFTVVSTVAFFSEHLSSNPNNAFSFVRKGQKWQTIHAYGLAHV